MSIISLITILCPKMPKRKRFIPLLLSMRKASFLPHEDFMIISNKVDITTSNMNDVCNDHGIRVNLNTHLKFHKVLLLQLEHRLKILLSIVIA